MNASPLQLTEYFLTELSFSANSQFHAEKGIGLNPNEFQVATEAQADKDNNRNWKVVIKLQYQPPADANAPYRFSVEILGFFLVLNGYPDEKIERLVRVNGPSMLYGALREIVKAVTLRGPYGAIILPSPSFYLSNEAAKAPVEQNK
jgi:preprotein translocase subunit SecB